MNRAGQQRDMVYCHQCENEWFRDEHGLTCPQCQSDFTEIIEPDHDPRAEQVQAHGDGDNEADFAMPGGFPHGHPLHGHYPFPHGAPDPDEDDIEQVQWRSNGPGQGTFRATFSTTGRPPAQGEGGPAQPHNSIWGIFGNILQNIGGPEVMRNLQQQGQRHGAQQQQGGGQGETGDHTQQAQHLPGGGGGGGQDSGRPRSAPGFRPGQEQGGPNIRIIHGHGPLGAFTVTSSVHGGLYPRDANGPQPRNQQVDGLQAMLDQMFGGMGGIGGVHFHPDGQGGPPSMMPNPFAIMFNQLFNPTAAASGDAVFTQEAFDRVISQLMEQNSTGNAPGPASQSAIASLPKRKLDLKDLSNEGRAECTICMDEVQVGEEITVLPCGHWFHGECVGSWLKEHDTCPHCRKGIMPKDDEGQAGGVRSPNQAPLHNMDPFSGGTGSLQDPLVVREAGSRDDPVTVPDSPEQAERRRQSFRRHSSHEVRHPLVEGEGSGGPMGIAERVRRAWVNRGRGSGSGSQGGGD